MAIMPYHVTKKANPHHIYYITGTLHAFVITTGFYCCRWHIHLLLCYDELIKDDPSKIKITNDTLLYDSHLESSFFHTRDYLTFCAKNGTAINENKSHFCQENVEFAGLLLTPDGISPSPKILTAINDFQVPKDLRCACSWFGIVNQITWTYAISLSCNLSEN